MPKVSEYFDFDEDEYKIKIKNISNKELKESIYKKRFRGNAATFSCGANMGLALAVGGATIIPGLISARAADIEDKKLHLLEKEWESRGQPELDLSGTAEIPLGGMFAMRDFAHEELPVKAVALGRAFRCEAGARGADTRGLYRVHQFTKLELFVACSQEKSEEMFKELIDLQVEIFSGLGLPLRY